MVTLFAQVLHCSQNLIMINARFFEDVIFFMSLIQSCVHLINASINFIAAVIDLFEQVFFCSRFNSCNCILFINDCFGNFICAFSNSRTNFAASHVAHRASLNVQQLAILLQLNLAAAFYLYLRQNAKLFKQVDVFLLNQSRDSIYCRSQVQKASAFCLIKPFISIAIAIKDDVLMSRQGLSDPCKSSLLKILFTLNCLIKLTQRFCNRSVQHRITIR